MKKLMVLGLLASMFTGCEELVLSGSDGLIVAQARHCCSAR